MARPDRKLSRAQQMAPQERRKQLLRAGVESFASKGIGGTKHADLARACDVSVPTIFSYFPNRSTLVNSILEEVGATLIEKVIVPAQQLPDPAERLPATAARFVELANTDSDYIKVWLMWSVHFAAEIQSEYRKFELEIIRALAMMFRGTAAGTDPDDDAQDRARMLIASSAFLAKMVFDGVSEKRRDEFVSHVLDAIALDS